MAALIRVGLISDTHGVLDPRVHHAFEGVDVIVHAGDVCRESVLFELETIAPGVIAVAGNCDIPSAMPGWDLPFTARTSILGTRILVIHDVHSLGRTPDDVDVVVCGHSHVPSTQWHGRVLVVNPGSASQRRRQPSRSVGIVEIAEGERPAARIVMLDDVAPPPL